MELHVKTDSVIFIVSLIPKSLGLVGLKVRVDLFVPFPMADDCIITVCGFLGFS